MRLCKRCSKSKANGLLREVLQGKKKIIRQVPSGISPTWNFFIKGYQGSFFDNKPKALTGYVIEDTKQLSLI